MPFDPVTAFAPISTMAQFDLLLLVKGDLPLQTLKGALDAARADPQKFNVGTINPGSTQNVTGELLRAATGIPMTVVPHRTSAEVLTSLLRGDTQIGIESYAALKSPIDAGQIRAIASSGGKRSPHAAGRADAARARHRCRGRRLEFAGGAGGHAEARSSPFSTATSAPIIADPDFQKRMIELGGEPVASSPEELEARLKSDIDLWAAVVKKAGLEPN